MFLEAFSGPLDLLLYLIKRQNLDILNIPIARVTEQYMTYIELMEVLQLELAGEYLVMAAMLAEIKSRMLLPRPEQEEDEEDPRAELVRRLQEYEIFKQAAQDIDDLPRLGRDCFAAIIDFPDKQCSLQGRPKCRWIQSCSRSVRYYGAPRCIPITTSSANPCRSGNAWYPYWTGSAPTSLPRFSDLFVVEEGRAGVIVVFLALLELARETLVEIVQNETNGPIYIKAVT